MQLCLPRADPGPPPAQTAACHPHKTQGACPCHTHLDWLAADGGGERVDVVWVAQLSEAIVLEEGAVGLGAIGDEDLRAAGRWELGFGECGMWCKAGQATRQAVAKARLVLGWWARGFWRCKLPTRASRRAASKTAGARAGRTVAGATVGQRMQAHLLSRLVCRLC